MREDSVKDDRQLIFAISGYKNSGKTTLIENLIPILTEYGYKVATIKHDAHDFEPDVPVRIRIGIERQEPWVRPYSQATDGGLKGMPKKRSA